MSNEEDLLKMFELNLDKEIPQQREEHSSDSYPYPVCQMTWSVPGLFTGKFVPDSSNRPFRTIKRVKEVKYFIPNKESGELESNFFRAAPLEEYKIALTEDQVNLYNEVLALIDAYEEYCSKGLDGFVKTRNTMVLFFMALQGFIDPSDANSDIVQYVPDSLTTMVHTSGYFTRNFQSQVNEKTSKMKMFGKDKSWIIDYIKRDPGEYNQFISISTTRADIGYNTTFDFFESPNKIVLTQEMLDAKPNLDTEIINNQVFDTEYWTKIRNDLKEVMDDKGIKVVNA